MKFVQLGTQIKHDVKEIYTKIHKKYIMKYIKTISLNQLLTRKIVKSDLCETIHLTVL